MAASLPSMHAAWMSWSLAAAIPVTTARGHRGTSGARSVRQFEFLPAAPDARAASNPWPQWPNVKKTDYGQQEAIAAMGGEMRAWGVDTLEVLLDKKGTAAGSRVADLDWSAGKPERIAGSGVRGAGAAGAGRPRLYGS